MFAEHMPRSTVGAAGARRRRRRAMDGGDEGAATGREKINKNISRPFKIWFNLWNFNHILCTLFKISLSDERGTLPAVDSAYLIIGCISRWAGTGRLL